MSSNLSKREILRKKRLEQKRRRNKTIILVALAALALITLTILLPNLISRLTTTGDGRGFPLGDPNAPVSVVNFSSYPCGFCADFSANVEPDLISNYIETGDVYYRYVNLAHSDPGSLNAAKASYCAADQDQFFTYKSFLYSAVGTQEGFSTNNLVNLAEAAGLDKMDFEACMEGSQYDTASSEDFRYAQSIGVTGTPTFFVNGQLVSSRELIPLIDSLLGN